MTKELLELSTREFVYVLLGYQPKQKFTIEWNYGDSSTEHVVEGTYQEIVDALSSDRDIRNWFEETTFDYQKRLDFTDAVTYLRHRTDHFDSDLAQALLIDINNIEKLVFAQVEAGFQDKNEFERWKESHTSLYYTIKSFLQSKCDSRVIPPEAVGCNRKSGTSELNLGILQGVPESGTGHSANDFKSPSGKVAPSQLIASDRFNHFFSKAKHLFIDGRWHNNEKKEYAIFLKVLFCIVFRREWKNNVLWRKLPILPLHNNTLLIPEQLSQVMKNYDEGVDGGIRKRFERMLLEGE